MIYPISVVIVFAIGIFFRVVHLFFIPKGVPFDLGGLYYEFALQIEQANFHFPVTIPFYTNGGLPFAYPPLVFFIEALIIHLFQPDKFLLVNILPPIFLVISLFVFYGLTRKLFPENKTMQVISLLAFAILPNAYQGSIQASGVVEAFSSIIVILFMYFTVGLKFEKIWDFVIVGAVGGLCVWSSPGGAYAVVYLFIALAVYLFGRRKNFWSYLLNLLIAGITIILVASPYLLTVIHNHSVSIFTQSFLGQHSSEVIKTQLIYTLSLKYLTNIDILWVFSLVGLVTLIKTRNWIIPFWFISLCLIPRESVWLIGASGALLIGYAATLLFNFIFDGLRSLEGRKKVSSWAVAGFCLLFLILKANLIYEDYYSFYKSVEDSLPTTGNIDTLEWMNQNLPEDAKVTVVVSNNGIIEWAPPIVQRTVLNVPYGTEFDVQKRAVISHFNKEVVKCKDIACISSSTQDAFSTNSYYLLISDYFLENINMNSDTQSAKLVYENEDLNLFLVNDR
jgi:hypothetical protein